jgi:hypothetical protein
MRVILIAWLAFVATSACAGGKVAERRAAF